VTRPAPLEGPVVPARPLGRMAVEGIFWSLVQNWSSRIIAFVIFVLLAKFLTPAQYGVASAAQTCLLFVGIVAEFGFGDAIIQRQKLEFADVNLPFFVAVGISILLAAGVALSAELIAGWLNVAGLAPVIEALSGIAPITTISQFQEFSYRKALDFRALATRVLVANLGAGAVAIACAYAGMGVWSIVIQTYLTVGIGLLWLWRRPRWKPSFELRPRQFCELASFGAPVVGMRVVDFATIRSGGARTVCGGLAALPDAAAAIAVRA
jgi:O-antigen/teichoic acid export membrane protein